KDSGASVGGRWHDHRGSLDVLVPDLPEVEGADVLGELREGLLEGGKGLPRARERGRAREEVGLQERVVQAAALQLLHRGAERLVRLAHEGRALFALGKRLREAPLEELVDALQDRGERAAREALVLLVEQAERDQVRR